MAVVVAMLIVALAASTAAAMLLQNDLWTRQLDSLGARAQADVVARAGIAAAGRVLTDPDGMPAPARMREAVKAAAAGLSGAGVTLELTYTDPQARFNLNNLVQGERASEPYLDVLREILALAKLSPDLASSIVDAIDGDSETSLPGGAEDLDYLAMVPPRRAANRPMLDAAHIARLKGWGADEAARLLPFVTALPGLTPVNVNTASAEAFRFIVPGLDAPAARALAAARDEAPFRDLASFRNQLPEGAVPARGLALSVSSRYVTLVSRARVGRAQVAYEALIALPGARPTGVLWLKQVDG